MLTGHGHLTLFLQMGLDGYAMLGEPSKGQPCKILILLPIMFYYIISTTYQKNGDLFLDFRIVWYSGRISEAKKQLFVTSIDMNHVCKL